MTFGPLWLTSGMTFGEDGIGWNFRNLLGLKRVIRSAGRLGSLALHKLLRGGWKPSSAVPSGMTFFGPPHIKRANGDGPIVRAASFVPLKLGFVIRQAKEWLTLSNFGWNKDAGGASAEELENLRASATLGQEITKQIMSYSNEAVLDLPRDKINRNVERIKIGRFGNLRVAIGTFVRNHLTSVPIPVNPPFCLLGKVHAHIDLHLRRSTSFLAALLLILNTRIGAKALARARSEVGEGVDVTISPREQQVAFELTRLTRHIESANSLNDLGLVLGFFTNVGNIRSLLDAIGLDRFLIVRHVFAGSELWPRYGDLPVDTRTWVDILNAPIILSLHPVSSDIRFGQGLGPPLGVQAQDDEAPFIWVGQSVPRPIGETPWFGWANEIDRTTPARRLGWLLRKAGIGRMADPPRLALARNVRVPFEYDPFMGLPGVAQVTSYNSIAGPLI